MDKAKGGTQYGAEFDFSRFNFSDDTISQIKERFEDIKSYHNKSIDQDNFQSLFDACYDIIELLPLPAVPIDPSTIHYLLRVRPNNNGEVFSKEEEISYNSTNIDKISLCRFNRPEESMFYGTLPSDSQEKFLVGVSLECCKDLTSDENMVEIQCMTFGKWTIKKAFSVLNLCVNERAMSAHPGLNKVIQNQVAEIKGKISPKSADLIHDFWQFFSNLSSEKIRSEQHYFITTSLFLAVREYYSRHYGERINGIIFPSSMVDGQALNIVLVPEAVEEYLELKEVFMYKYIRTPGNKKSWTGGICSHIAKVDNHRFEINGILPGNEIYSEIRYSDGQ